MFGYIGEMPTILSTDPSLIVWKILTLNAIVKKDS